MSEEQEKNNVAAEAGSEVNSDEFSLDNLKSHFETCLAEDGSISIDKYLLGETIHYFNIRMWIRYTFPFAYFCCFMFRIAYLCYLHMWLIYLGNQTTGGPLLVRISN